MERASAAPYGTRIAECEQVRLSSGIGRYGAAVAATAGAVLVQRLLWSFIPPSPFLIFYPAVLLVARFAGLGPALLCTGLSVLAEAYWFLPPYNSLSVASTGDALDLTVYGALASLLAFGVHRIETSKSDAERSEEKFRGIISLANEGIVSIDDDQNIVVYNDGAEHIFGWKREEALGRPLDFLIPERLRERHRQHIRIFAGEAVNSRRLKERQPIMCLRKGGVEFPAEAAISKIEVGGKKLFSVVLRDITERRKIEAEKDFFSQVATILASTIHYEETLSRVADLVVRDLADCCIIDFVEEDGHVRRPKVFHRDPAMAPVTEALQRVDLDSRRPHLASAVLEENKPLLIPEVTADYLVSVAQSDEHLHALRNLAPRSLMAVPLMESGQLLGALLFIRTSSNEPYGRHDLHLAEELGRRAAVSVHHARLYRAAQRATEAREEILRIVAHDLRNHLNSILMQAALLQRGRPEGERRSPKPGDSIHRVALRMNRLINDLLDVACIEAGQFAVERDLVAAEQVVLDVTEAQKSLVSSAGLDLRLDVARGLPTISVDRERMQQVFENLIGNAVKFAPSGGRITVGTTPNDGEVLFWVENTGSRIPAEHLPHVFDRFWQARKGEHRGAGLGLSIVKGIVEAHGGRVWAESTEGRGTTIYLTVPVVSGTDEVRGSPEHANSLA